MFVSIGLSIFSIQSVRFRFLPEGGSKLPNRSCRATYETTYTRKGDRVSVHALRNGACLAIEVGGRAVPSRLSVCSSSSSSFLYLSPFYTCPHLTSVARRVARRTKHGPECKIRKTAAANKRTLLKQKRRQLTDVFITAKSKTGVASFLHTMTRNRPFFRSTAVLEYTYKHRELFRLVIKLA